jgi:hypothetical protein
MPFSKNPRFLCPLFVLTLFAACSSSKGTGGARQACYANGTCNTGLICLSSVCVAPPDGGAGTTGTAGIGGSSGGAGADGSAAGTSGGDAAAGTSGGDAAAGTSGGDAAAGHDATAGTSGGDAAAGSSVGDAATESGGDAVANCGLPSSFGALTFSSTDQVAVEFVLQAFVNGQPMGTIDEVDWNGQFDTVSATNANMLGVILDTMLTPFGDTLAPMSNIDLAGEGDLSTCGACALVVVGANPQNPGSLPLPQLGPTYMPVSGTMTITQVPSFPAVAGSRVTGSLSNVSFRHVDIDPTTSATTPAADGCKFTVTSAAFDTTVTND